MMPSSSGPHTREAECLARECARLRRATFATGAAVALALVWVVWPFSTWTGRRVELVDDEGLVRGVIEVTDAGVVLEMRGIRGQEAISLRAPNHGAPEVRVGGVSGSVLQPGRLVLEGPDGGHRVRADANGDGGLAVVEVQSPSGRAALEAGPRAGRVVIRDASGERTCPQDAQ